MTRTPLLVSLLLVACGSEPKSGTPAPSGEEALPESEPREPCSPITWYEDRDGDGFGNAFRAVEACSAPAGWVQEDTDCDDTDPDAFPGQTWYADIDGDGFGDAALSAEECARPDGYVATDGDCDDGDSTRNPESLWFRDADSDGHGDPAAALPSCEATDGTVATDDDCDDTDAAVNPTATEVCDWIDNDCNALIDEDDPGLEVRSREPLYTDADGDGWGTEEFIGDHCPSSGLGATVEGDCDDTDAAIHPDMLELPDDVDQNCDGETYYSFLDTLPDGIGNDTAGEEFGDHLWSADLDSDGDHDLLLGYPGASDATGELVWWDDATPTDLSTPTSTTATWTGTAAGARVGAEAMPVGDFDGDGVEDLLVLDLGVAGTEPTVWLLGVDTPSGPVSDGAWSWTLPGQVGSAPPRLLLLGDIDSDGQPEALASQPAYSEAAGWNNEGALFLLDPDDIGSSSDPRERPYITGAWRNYALGQSMAVLADADGDGLPEVLTGSWAAYASGAGSGAAYLLSPDDLTTDGFSTDDAATVLGVDGGLNAGRYVGSLGDFDGDGYGDFAVSSRDHAEAGSVGSLHIFYGHTDVLLSTPTIQEDDATLMSLNNWDELGTGIHPVEDFDGDGQSDLILANEFTDLHSSGSVVHWSNQGAVYGICGQRLSGSSTIEEPAAFAIRGPANFWKAGASVTSAGDRDGDGLHDIWIGSYDDDGSVYLLPTGMIP